MSEHAPGVPGVLELEMITTTVRFVCPQTSIDSHATNQLGSMVVTNGEKGDIRLKCSTHDLCQPNERAVQHILRRTFVFSVQTRMKYSTASPCAKVNKVSENSGLVSGDKIERKKRMGAKRQLPSTQNIAHDRIERASLG